MADWGRKMLYWMNTLATDVRTSCGLASSRQQEAPAVAGASEVDAPVHARCSHLNGTLWVMASQRAVQALAGPARLTPYAEAASGDISKATDLYIWAGHLAGALHSTISFVEVAVRNSLNAQLIEWNAAQPGPYGRDWALTTRTAPLLYGLIGAKRLKFARESAEKESYRRPRDHPRRRAAVTNDDVVAQLMLGAWVNLVSPISGTPARQQQLWRETLWAAFPGVDRSDAGRRKVGSQLARIRNLRNRVAHHDNLLGVEVDHRLNDMLAVLRTIDDRFPELAMARSQVRMVLREDPRRSW